jgi:hypothetical protein
VREHGWRSGRALVRRHLRGRTVLAVRFPDGDVLTASDVYVGGHGNALSIMFLTGPFVVAAKPQLHHGHPRNEPM